jgi:hypothetical protein
MLERNGTKFEYRLCQYGAGNFGIHAYCPEKNTISKYAAAPTYKDMSIAEMRLELEDYQQALSRDCLQYSRFSCWDYEWINWEP